MIAAVAMLILGVLSLAAVLAIGIGYVISKAFDRIKDSIL